MNPQPPEGNPTALTPVPVQEFIGPLPLARSGLDGIFGGFWPEVSADRVPARPRLVVAAAVVATLGAVLLPGQDFGLGLGLIMLGAMAVIGYPLRVHAGAEMRAMAGLAVLLVSMVIVRDAEWLVLLCGVAAYAVGAAALSRSASVAGMIISSLSIPLAWLRGLPWLRRSLSPRANRVGVWPIARTLAVSTVLVLIFGALFSSADAVFAQWVTLVLPQFTVDDLGFRLVVFTALVGLTLGGTYVAVNPPKVEKIALRPGRSVRRFEWVTPVSAVIGLFAAFLVAQMAALFGGHAYLQRTTGLTYAQYVHQGFGQLTAVTAVVLVVVAVALRRAPRASAADRGLLRLLLGLLCGLALVVVASALYRVHVYEQAYGFTRLRLLVTVFEGWLGFVLALTMTAGVWLKARWAPKVAVLAGVVLILGTALASPDAIIARHNVERLQISGRVDWEYLSGLSDDAVPALDRLPEPYRSCTLRLHHSRSSTGLSWNVGRVRAAAVLRTRPVDQSIGCDMLGS